MNHEFVSTPQRFLTTASRAPSSPAYYIRGKTSWLPTNWAAFRAQVQSAARGLVALGVQPGDRLSILSYNRPEWVILDIAAMMVGAAPIGIYFTASPSEISFIVQDSGSVVLAAENAVQYAKFAGSRAELATLRRVILMEGEAESSWQIGWHAFLALGDETLDGEIAARLAAIRPADVGCLIYTSGTTGMPKAVSLSHAALCHCIGVIAQTMPQSNADRCISYLPLAHIAERMLSVHAFAAFGPKLYFARSVAELAQHLLEMRPTIMFGVPRVWEKFYNALREKLETATGAKARIAAWAQATGRAWHEEARSGRAPAPVLDIQKRIAERLVYAKVKAAIGLDGARILFSGAAPIAPEILEFLAGLDIVVYELYGQSETCGPTTTNLPGANRLGSVGRAVPGTELRIAPDGEVLLRDAKLFTEYAGRPDATAETLIDGWLYSGDLGRLDEDGYLFITGRKKDLIITAGGKNIAPAAIEAALEAVPLIEHAVIYGDRKPYCVALVTLKPDHAAAFAAPDGPADDAAIRAEVQRSIDAVNEQQSRVAAIRKFVILPGRFSVETGELTATLKTKRAAIVERYRPLLEGMYEPERVG
jgi:long-chain acyl-CoA synthetase